MAKGIDPWMEEARRALETSIAVKRALLERQLEVIVAVARRLERTLREERRIYFIGNGGSAADAQHLAAELVGKFYLERRPLPAMALTTNTSALTAIANDLGYEEVFSRQVEGLLRPGDLLFALSTSGRSPNILAALRSARAAGAQTVLFTGEGGAGLAREVDELLVVPSRDTPRIQEAHIAAGHIVCALVEAAIFGPKGARG